MRTRLTGGRIVLANEIIEDGSTTVKDGRIAEIDGVGRPGDTEIDLEDIVRFMVSEGWWMTGQTILVNGGYTTK